MEIDVAFHNDKKAVDRWVVKKQEEYNALAYAPLDFVKEQIKSTGCSLDQVWFVKGKVEDTLPKQIPNKISILRLDTDWYESTKHELVNGEVLIVDDYNWFKGSRNACDEYFKENNINIMLSPLGVGGAVIGIKV